MSRFLWVVAWPIRASFIYIYVATRLLIESLVSLKSRLIRRMFWGRGGLYRTIFHLIIIGITGLLLYTNLSSRLTIGVIDNSELVFSYASTGNNDVLEQGTTLKSIVAIDPGFPEIRVQQYAVKNGDTLDSIAADFEITKDTIRWANSRIISPFNDSIRPGWMLDIPEMNGVLYTVISGDTIDSIADKTFGDRASIVELNRIPEIDGTYRLATGEKIFIPDGRLEVLAFELDDDVQSFEEAKRVLDAMPAGTFGNPLSQCPGYRFSRGISGYHHGVDYAKGGGCKVVAAAAGRVMYVGWNSLSGFHVIIDHGSQIKTLYFHAQPGTLKVSKDEFVSKGQELFWMGCTGRCTGTHLHFELVAARRYLNPLDYVPF